jgi:hypothetical protein
MLSPTQGQLQRAAVRGEGGPHGDVCSQHGTPGVHGSACWHFHPRNVIPIQYLVTAVRGGTSRNEAKERTMQGRHPTGVYLSTCTMYLREGQVIH